MSEAHPAAAEGLAFIKQRLRVANIAQAAIVDDVFDGVSTNALEPGLDDFVDAISIDAALFADVQKFCKDLKEAEDFDLECGRQLWSAREQWTEVVKPHAELLFNVYQQRLDALVQLARNLEQLELQVYKLGRKAKVPTNVCLVFLDYCLEPEREMELVRFKQEQLAEAGGIRLPDGQPSLAEQIAAQLAVLGGQRPFLVLISDRPELSRVRADFRRRTNYLASTFACLSKANASNQESLYINLCSWGIGHPALRPIHEFFEAVVDSLKATAEDFRKELLELDAQDYSFIQRLSLADDGEPLGEYMLDLIANAMSYRLRDQPNVRESRLALDRQHFPIHIPSSTQPSFQLRRLYQQALTEPGIQEIGPHPLQHLQTPPALTPMPRLALGDIFADDQHQTVHMVLNAACDLQFSPANPDRIADALLPVYLMPGNLEPLNRRVSRGTSKRTEIFELDNSAYRILWDHKHVSVVLLNAFEAWRSSGRYRRVARLGPLHALALQQTWISDLGRVGLPVTPPLTDSADFRIYLRDINNRLELFGSRVYGQVILGNYRKKNEIVEYFFVTTDGMLSLRAAMSEAAARFRTFAAMAPDGGPSSAKVGSMRKLGDCAAISSQAWEYWLELVEREHVLPRLQGKKWSPRNESIRTPITFCWEAYPAGKTISEFGGGDILIVVDILSPDAPDELSPPAGAQASEPPSTPPPPPAPSTEVALADSAPAGTQANEAPSTPPQPLLGK